MIETINPNLLKKTAIFECEFFAVFCSFWLWGLDVTDAVVIYTDNNGVGDTLISCNTRNKIAREVLIATLATEGVLQITPWYARVPIDSNYADAPLMRKTAELGCSAMRHQWTGLLGQGLRVGGKLGRSTGLVLAQRSKDLKSFTSVVHSDVHRMSLQYFDSAWFFMYGSAGVSDEII